MIKGYTIGVDWSILCIPRCIHITEIITYFNDRFAIDLFRSDRGRRFRIPILLDDGQTQSRLPQLSVAHRKAHDAETAQLACLEVRLTSVTWSKACSCCKKVGVARMYSTSMSTVGLFDKASILGWAVYVDQIGTVLRACVLRKLQLMCFC